MNNEQKLRVALDHIASFQPVEKGAFKGWQEWNRAGEYAASIAREAISADKAKGAEPVAWIIHWDNDPDDVVTSMHNDDLQQSLGAGWPIQYLYTASPPTPVIPQCFMTAESGNGGYRLVMKFQSLVDLHKAHDAMLAAAPAPKE